MRKWMMISIVMVAAAMSHQAMGGVQVQRSAGDTNLQQAGPFDDDKVQTVTLNRHGVDAAIKLRIDEFFDAMTVNAGTTVRNTSDQPVFFHLYIAFFNEAGELVGAAAQGTFGDDGLAAGEETQLGSLIIPLPMDHIETIATYKAVLYTSDAKIGAADD